MSEEKRFVLRRLTGDVAAGTEQELKDWLQKGMAKPGDFVYDATAQKWNRLGDHPVLSGLSAKPAANPEKRVVYLLPVGAGMPMPIGPFSIKETQQRIQARDVSESSWVFVEGDKEWRQVKSVKALLDMLPPLPTDRPQPPAASVPAAASIAAEQNTGPTPAIQTNPSIQVDMSLDLDVGVEREEPTMAISALGLASGVSASPPPPAMPKAPAPAPAAAKPSIAFEKDTEAFDGITAEIPIDPIWLVKPANAETISGPFRFLEVMKFLEEGRLTKNDKISKVGANRFVKIQQQYEFNVKYSVEMVVEGGIEKQKILIRRRHPRVPYITGIQVMCKHGLLPGTCVNISAGGILMEMPKADFNLGEIVELKILPGLIQRAISCKSLVIGRIPKIPPGYALKFEDLKNEDKEAIEFFVAEALRREMAKNS